MQRVEAGTRSQPRATDRGLSLVVLIADHPHGLPLAELARAVELSASTVLRQMRSLEAAGFAVRRDDGIWVPGPELLRLARSLSSTMALPRLAGEILRAIAETTGESAYLAEPIDDDCAVYVALEPGTHAVRHVSWLGNRVPRRGTAVGAALAGEVDHDGVAVRLDAVERGVTAVSAPVTDGSGRIIAAMSIIGPSFRLHGERLVSARHLLADKVAQLATLMGGTR